MHHNRREFIKQSGLFGLGVSLAQAGIAQGETASAAKRTIRTKEPVLCYREDKTFKIVQFTDIHWGEGTAKDRQSVELMEMVLDAETPDLVVLTGDSITGKDQASVDAYKTAYTSITKPMVSRNIPWAAVFGNHDDEGPMSRSEQMAFMRTIPYCLSQSGPTDIAGESNYTHFIYDHQGKKPQNTLYFIDSLGYAPKEIEGYAWISRGQINWYVQTAKQIKKQYGTSLPALAFFHIPFPEYVQAFGKETLGVQYEDVCCPDVNSGFYSALLEAGDVMGTFVGHDHINDYEGTVFGIRLCYGRATGYNTYGKEGYPRGGRVIVLEEGKKQFQTWQRVEKGRIIDYRK